MKLYPWQKQLIKMFLDSQKKGNKTIISWPRGLGKTETTKIINKLMRELNGKR